MPASESSKIRAKELPCPVADCTKHFTCERGIRDHLSLYKERFQDFAYKALEEQFIIAAVSAKDEKVPIMKKVMRQNGRESFGYLSAHYEAWKNRYSAEKIKESFESRHRQAAKKYRVNNKDKVRRMVKLSKFRAKAKKLGYSADEAEERAQSWIKVWEKKYPAASSTSDVDDA